MVLKYNSLQVVGNVGWLTHLHLSLPPLFDGVAVYVLRMDCGGDDVIEITHSLSQKCTQWGLTGQKLCSVLLRNAGEEQHTFH